MIQKIGTVEKNPGHSFCLKFNIYRLNSTFRLLYGVCFLWSFVLFADFINNLF
jgi:hypothetical protein